MNPEEIKAMGEVAEAVRALGALMEGEMAKLREQLVAATAEAATRRSERDQSRQWHAAAEVRIMQLEKALAEAVRERR